MSTVQARQRVDEASAVPEPRRPVVNVVRRVVARGVLGLCVLLLAVFILGPLVWLSLRAFAASWSYPSLLPESWTLSWWRQVLADQTLGSSIRLSFTFAPVVTALSALICLPAAYAFARFNFPGRRVLLVSLFATNAFPKIGLFVSVAGLLYSLHLMGTFLGVVVVQLLGTIVFMTWIPAAAFASVPRSLEEAARDVGAGPLRVFFTVTFPLAAPGILVAMILSFLASFDEAQGTFLVGAPNYITMPTEMYTLVLNYPEQAAAVFSILLSIPSVLLMLLVRRHVMGGRLAEGFHLR
ncbi:ABC transporter permease [Thermasporomyces composti]|jgi:putative spermidine/putrescine transport system permease protein|uniref:Putative spermidine/putrescine transport system permease protein n=1 Tax=Thermasporomyces composti TaxID=696763 RepID=A0A3D9V0T2_THECX|nr:ABC transporter permease subunit [Thermasporomyces composti]REF35089.1 putative spermidine/putrescine transport system permease protein [Thermasporomyces composti]